MHTCQNLQIVFECPALTATSCVSALLNDVCVVQLPPSGGAGRVDRMGVAQSGGGEDPGVAPGLSVGPGPAAGHSAQQQLCAMGCLALAMSNGHDRFRLYRRSVSALVVAVLEASLTTLAQGHLDNPGALAALGSEACEGGEPSAHPSPLAAAMDLAVTCVRIVSLMCAGGYGGYCPGLFPIPFAASGPAAVAVDLPQGWWTRPSPAIVGRGVGSSTEASVPAAGTAGTRDGGVGCVADSSAVSDGGCGSSSNSGSGSGRGDGNRGGDGSGGGSVGSVDVAAALRRPPDSGTLRACEQTFVTSLLAKRAVGGTLHSVVLVCAEATRANGVVRQLAAPGGKVFLLHAAALWVLGSLDHRAFPPGRSHQVLECVRELAQQPLGFAIGGLHCALVLRLLALRWLCSLCGATPAAIREWVDLGGASALARCIGYACVEAVEVCRGTGLPGTQEPQAPQAPPTLSTPFCLPTWLASPSGSVGMGPGPPVPPTPPRQGDPSLLCAQAHDRFLWGMLHALFPWGSPARGSASDASTQAEVATWPSQVRVPLVHAVGQDVGLPRPVLAPGSAEPAPQSGSDGGAGDGSGPKVEVPRTVESLEASSTPLSLLGMRAGQLWEPPFVGSCVVEPAAVLRPFCALLAELASVGTGADHHASFRTCALIPPWYIPGWVPVFSAPLYLSSGCGLLLFCTCCCCWWWW
jgi:hypothetical protein